MAKATVPKKKPNESRLRFFEVFHFCDSLPQGSLTVQRSMLRLILASFFSMVVSVALSADLLNQSHERTYSSNDRIGCSCDAPGFAGKVCATPDRCEEVGGLCAGGC